MRRFANLAVLVGLVSVCVYDSARAGDAVTFQPAPVQTGNFPAVTGSQAAGSIPVATSGTVITWTPITGDVSVASTGTATMASTVAGNKTFNGTIDVNTTSPGNPLGTTPFALRTSTRSTDDSSGTQMGVESTYEMQEDGGNSAFLYATVGQAGSNTASYGTYTGTFTGIYGNAYCEGFGNCTKTRGVLGIGQTFSSNGQRLLTAEGGEFFTQTGSSSTTINTGYAVRARNLGESGTTIGKVGILADEITGGTNNTDMLIGSTTVPDGNYALASESARPSYMKGTLDFVNCVPLATILDGGEPGAGTIACCSNCATQSNPCIQADGGNGPGALLFSRVDGTNVCM